MIFKRKESLLGSFLFVKNKIIKKQTKKDKNKHFNVDNKHEKVYHEHVKKNMIQKIKELCFK